MLRISVFANFAQRNVVLLVEAIAHCFDLVVSCNKCNGCE